MSDLQRPECFEFGMDFLGTPEEPIIRAYVEQLEDRVRQLEAIQATPTKKPWVGLTDVQELEVIRSVGLHWERNTTRLVEATAAKLQQLNAIGQEPPPKTYAELGTVIGYGRDENWHCDVKVHLGKMTYAQLSSLVSQGMKVYKEV